MLRSFGNKLKARNGKDRAFKVLNGNTGDMSPQIFSGKWQTIKQ